MLLKFLVLKQIFKKKNLRHRKLFFGAFFEQIKEEEKLWKNLM